MKKHQNKKFDEKWYRLFIKEAFIEKIKNFRLKIGIPIDGFSTLEESREWSRKWAQKMIKRAHGQHKQQNPNEIHIFIMSLINDYKLTFEFYSHISNFIFHGNKFMMPARTEYGCEVINETMWPKYFPILEEIETGVFIKIMPDATKNDILRFIDLKWDDIHWWQKRVSNNSKNVIIRKFRNKERDDLIYKLYKKPINELNVLAGHSYKLNKYKDIVTRVILKNQYGKEVSEEAIRKIISRQRQLRK